MTTTFQPGDRVRVVESFGTRLPLGSEHEVRETATDSWYGPMVIVHGDVGEWCARRFEKIETPAPVTFTVGDRVRYVGKHPKPENVAKHRIGEEGEVIRITPHDSDGIRVRFDGGSKTDTIGWGCFPENLEKITPTTDADKADAHAERLERLAKALRRQAALFREATTLAAEIETLIAEIGAAS